MKKLDKKNIKDILALTPTQEGMLYHYLKEPESNYYVVQLSLEISGEIDFKTFEAAWNFVIESNEMLRAVFRWEKAAKPTQIILKNHYLLPAYHDLSGKDTHERQPISEDLKARDRNAVLDLQEVPFRITLCKTGCRTYEMIITHHHILYDGWSTGIILKEFLNAYTDLCSGKQLIKPGKNQFKEFVKWTQDLEEKNAEVFWKEYLKGLDTVPEISIKRKFGTPPKNVNREADHFRFTGAVRKKITDFAAGYKITLAALIYSAWGILLQKYNNTDDVIFGTTVSGRSVKIKSIEEMVGLFINTLPFRTQTHAGENILDLLERTTGTLKIREAYESTPLVRINEYINRQTPEKLFDSIVVIENYPLDKKLKQSGSSLSVNSYSTLETPHYDLTIGITLADEIDIACIYHKDGFDKENTARMICHFESILRDMAAHPGKRILDIEIISPEEKNKILYEFNNTGADFSEYKIVHGLFEDQAVRTPDGVAVLAHSVGAQGTVPLNGIHLTYSELNKKSNQLAHLLREKGVKPDTVVGIMVERSIEMIVGILGILKAGGAYLPIDPEYPKERINYMLADSNAKVLLSEVSKVSGETEFVTHLTHPTHLCCVIYTSGSTGKPRGVMVEHRNLVAYLKAFEHEFAIVPGDTIVQQTSFSFDAFAEEIYPILLKGGKIAVPAKDEVMDVARLSGFLLKNCVNIIDCSPLLLNELNQLETANLDNIHTFISGGDVLKGQYIDNILKKGKVYNTYGPTEATVCAAYYRCPGDSGLSTPIPIGKPILNYRLVIIDRNIKLQPVGIPGELCISGPGVTRGYLNRPELTAEKFIFMSYKSNRSYRTYISKKIYKTGDLARWLPDGNIEFLGRIDQQVKIRGFRIELGEIENRLSKHRLIKEAVIIDRSDGYEDKYLCAYIVSRETPDTRELKEFLSHTLPRYMIPSFFVQIDKIPLTPSGKVDRKALPSPAHTVKGKYTAPRDEIERKLVEIWSTVLGIEHLLIGIDDNFFELGGHSLKATRLVSRIHKELDIIVPIPELFKLPTIRDLAENINKSQKRVYSGIELTEEKEYYRVSSAQKRLYILQQMEKDNISYNMIQALVVEGELDKERLEKAFRRLIERHESFRTSFEMVNGEPVQKIQEGNFKFQVPNEIENFVQPFDLSKAPLLRVGLFKLEPGKHILMVDMHHIVSDGVSTGILIKDFTAVYAGEKLPPIGMHYRDFSEWQNSRQWKEAIKDQETYWLKQFEGDVPVLDLPTDFPRPFVQQFEGRTLFFQVGNRETAALKEIAAQQQATLYMILLSIFTIFLAKISNREDMVIGTPAAARSHADLETIIGMFVNTLALRNYPEGENTFLTFLDNVKKHTLEAFENQDYPFEELVENVSINRDSGRNPLFDVMFVLQDLDIPVMAIPGLTLTPLEYAAAAAKFDLTFICEKEKAGESLHFAVEYSTKLFKERTIQRFIRYFKRVVSHVTRAPGTRTAEIELISEKEKKEILYDFNDTQTDYPADKTIHQLFEEQAVRRPDGAAAVGAQGTVPFSTDRVTMTYRELNKKSDQLAHLLREKGIGPDTIVAIMVERSLEMIIGILGILKAGGAYLPIELDYPEERIKYMLEDSGAKILLSELSELSKVSGETEVVTHLTHPAQLCYVIYTSGTTGQPKGVLTMHTNVVRVVRNTNYIQIKNNDRILQLSNYAFDGSVFDIYGALLNGAALVLPGGEKVMAVDQLAALIKREQITVFFVTTALFNTLVDFQLDCFRDIRNVLFGGERISVEHSRKALEYMGKDRIIHVYGPTETTVYASYYFIDTIDENAVTIPIGKPLANTEVYLLDKNLKPVPIGVTGEVFISGKGTARGYLNRPELTAEKFLSASYRSYRTYISKKLYKTGDLARWLPDGNIEFIGRIDHQVKLRGFRIELGEIESQLVNHDEIKEAVVLLKEDKQGTRGYLCAYYVSSSALSLAVSELRESLSKSLPHYMIPSYFVQIDEIPLTSNGKVDRRKLPEPGVTSAGKYEAPANEIEEKLVEIWAEVLNIDRTSIGMNDNFFELGGHSLKATVVMSMIRRVFDVPLTLSELFKHPFIRQLSQTINEAVTEQYISIEAAEAKNYYLLSSAQKRLYILQQTDEEDMTYNMPLLRVLEGKLDKERLATAFRRLVERHESFRTSFGMVNGEPVQKIHREVRFEIQWGETTSLIKGFIRPFALSQAPLLRVGLVRLEPEKHLLMIDMHHIISDGTSMKIFINDFMALYANPGRELPPLWLQYKDFSRWQNSKKGKEIFKAQEKYWLAQFPDEVPGLELNYDYLIPVKRDSRGNRYDFELTPEETEVLKQFAQEEGVTLFMFLLAIYVVLLHKLSWSEDIVVGTPVMAREHAELHSIIGMFVNTLALRNYPSGDKTFKYFLKEVKQHTLQSFENQAYPFDELVEKIRVKGNEHAELVNTMFALQNIGISQVEIPGLVLKPYDYKHPVARFDLTLIGVEEDEILRFEIEYRTGRFKIATIERFAGHFQHLLKVILENANIKISDMELLLEEEKRQLLFDFNDTEKEYPRDKTIHQLFEEQAARTPDSAAVTGHSVGAQGTVPLNGIHLTYSELNEKSNQLAHLLREKGVKPDTIVGIMVEPSLEMIIGMLGILKAGGAYLPIDPDYPRERIDYMLKDSKAEVLLCELSKMMEGIEVVKPGELSEEFPTRLCYIIYTSGSTGKPKGVMVEHRSLVNLCFWHNRHYSVTPFDRASKYAGFGFDASVWEVFPYLIIGASLFIVPEKIKFDIGALNRYFEMNCISIGFLPTPICEQFMTIDNSSLRVLLTGGDKLKSYVKKDYQLFNNYGPTENTVVATSYHVTELESNIPIGTPLDNNQVYIVDKNSHLQPIGVPGELCIGGDSLARGYLNNQELTAEKFLSFSYRSYRSYKTYIAEKIYKTGDLARWLPDGSVEFLGRIDLQVKIRGYRIEPGEIENRLLSHPDIKEALVMVRQHENGEKYLCVYVVGASSSKGVQAIDVSSLKEYLSNELPDYMVPDHFVLLEKMPLNPNGKVDIKALPAPGMESGQEYAAPRDDIERRLVKIWLDVLGRDVSVSIGIDDNFFRLGGHSLNTTILATRIHQAFHVELSLSEVFKRRTVRKLGEYIRQAHHKAYIGIEPVEKMEYYPLSSAQKRLYFLQQMDLESTAYNMPLILPVGKEINRQAFESALKQLITRHESLRTSFIKMNDVPVQKIHDNVEFEVEYYDQELPTDFVRPFDLSRAPLVRSGMIGLPGGNHTWLVDIHHIASDGTSHMILAGDFMSFYERNARGLEPLRLQYKDFSQWQNGLFASGVIKAQEDYWQQLYADSKEIPRLHLLTDYKRPEVFSFKGDVYRFSLEKEEAVQFKALGSISGGTLYMNILAVLNTLFYKYTGQTDIIIGTGIAGRPHADLQGIIGMFVNTLAMRNYPQEEKTYQSFLKDVITRSVRAFENQDVQFEELVDKLDLERDPSRNPLFDILMVVQNFRQPPKEFPGSGDSGQIESLPFTSKFDMTFFVHEEEESEDVFVDIEYYTSIFKQETIIRLVRHFKKLIEEVVVNPLIKLDDIDIVSEEEKHQLLHQFNNTGTPYPREKTIGELFDEQVEKTPHSIAAVEIGVGADEDDGRIVSISYKELGRRSDQIANYLCGENGISPGQPVGILMDKTLAMVSAIIGILKAGGAYVPLSPLYPEERIKTLVNEANMKVLIGQRRYIKTLNRLQWECPTLVTFLCIDSEDVHSEEESEENELMSRKLWEYVGETSVDEVTGGGWNSSYTGGPIPGEEMDEYGDNILKKLEPLLNRDMRVLEIGAASGISMYRIAPRVGFYYGTDLSDVIIEKNRQRVKEEEHKNIKLSRLAAHEIEQLDEEDFDLVVLNSVIQCFKGHNYLRKVFRKAINLMGSSGYIFVGDIMDQDLKQDLIDDLARFKEANRDKNYKTKSDWSEELFISRSFLEDLRFDSPEIKGIEFSGKIFTIENELTRFRYDALIYIDKKGKKSKRKKGRHKNQHDLGTLRKYGWGKAFVGVNSGTDNLAYVIYTSGTTGRPKGVMVDHGNVVRLVKNTNYVRFGTGERLLQTGALSFDASTFEIWGSLLNGLELYLAQKEDLLTAETLKEIIHKFNISTIWMTAPWFNRMVDTDIEIFNGPGNLLVGGDVLSPPHIYRVKHRYPGLNIINGYGPTENTTFSTTYPIESKGNTHVKEIPIGKPIANSTAYIVDKNGCLVPIGVTGELWVGGDGAARGYLNDPELTAEKFLSASYRSNRSYRSYKTYISKKLYKTGDLARWLADGNIEFLGRIDHQVKIRGFRIELGEIENRLLQHDLIMDVVVIAREEVRGDKYLCAYIVPKKPLDNTELREFLSQTLPDYMIPAYFMQLDKIPLTANGKVERKALSPPGVTVGEKYKAPGDELEKKLVEIWSEVLGLGHSTIGIDDDFFDLGGHSLKATVLTSKIQKELDVKVPLSEIFKGPTIRELARTIGISSREAYAPIKPAEKKEYYPLSSAQARFYILQEVTPESTAYNMTAVHRVEGNFDKEKFEESINVLIERHETLRSSFQSINGQPVQRVHEEVEFEIRQHTASAVLHADIIQGFVRPFDLSKAPLLRLGLVKISSNQHFLMFDMHHIITDGTSMSIFLKEFMTLYSGGKLSPLTLQYKDFSQWQHDQLVSGKLKKHEEYWLKRFKGGAPVLDIPTDFPRPPVQSFDGDKFDFTIDKSLTGDLKHLIKKTGTTLYMVLLAVYNILLSRYSGQEDIVVGTTIAGRHHPDLQKVIGLLIETLVQRNHPRGNLEFKTFLEMVKQETLETHENQAYPFREIIRLLDADNEVSRNPVFDAMLIVQNFEAAEFQLEGLKFLPYHADEEEIQHTSKVDFTIEAMENKADGDIRFTLEYCTRLYRRETMERFARHFINIIREAAAEPDIRLADIDVMDEAEKQQLLETFNDTAYKTGKGIPKMVLERFEDQAARTPDRVAVTAHSVGAQGAVPLPADHISITYRELNEKSNQLAHLLRQKGVQTESIVGIMMESSLEMAIAIWGILKAGGAYLPIETDYPRDRIQYMINDSKAEVLLSEVSEVSEVSGETEVIKLSTVIEEFPGHPTPLTHLTHPTHLCYIIYTSGTSGWPKGVMVEHGNLANYIDAVENEIDICSNDTVLQQGSFAFDAFVEEFYPILVKGGRAAIPGRMLVRDIPGLCVFIARNQVSMIASAPQLVNELNKALREGLSVPLNPRSLLASLRIVLVGGDVVKAEYIDKLLELAEVHNTYGPTESTVCATYYRCLKSHDLLADVPIGKPLARYRVYIFGRYGNLLPIGIGGELCVAGPGVTRGYLNQPELTAGRYYRSYRSYKTYSSEKIYKTGDLARWLSDGNIEFLGRIDRQVKIRGYRIELAEIESRLAGLDDIKEAVVVDRERKSGEKFLAAYVVCNGPIDAAEVKSLLARDLPDYMIPPYIVEVEEIPWTTSGKVDRKRLPHPDARSGSLQPFVAPEGQKEKQLAEIWKEILETDRMGKDDNFFDLGGTSLDIIKVNTRIKEEFNKQIPVVSLFKYTTIRSLVRYLDEIETAGNPGIPGEKHLELLEAIESGQKKLKGRLNGEREAGLDTAVIGMAGKFPGAGDLHEFWNNLKNGVESIRFFTDEELLQEGEDEELLKAPNYIKAKGVIEGVEYFDASFFGYTPMEAQLMDPQMRVFQQCIWHALEDAGYNPFSYNRRIGLYAGASPNFFWEGMTNFSGVSQGLSGFMVAQLANKDFMCTHISYKLNLKGPSVSVQTACSTSLVAIHYAVQGLLHGECELALAGGVSITYPYKRGYIYQEGMIFSPDGHHRSFDAEGKGSVFGDGVGVVALKPLEEAIADRDYIYAVIKGTAINNDGFRKVGYTAPSVDGQAEVIRGAQLMAEVEPESITYLEAHGTATPLGDTVEIEALKQAFNTNKKKYCALGTVKSNMGHLYSAAGAAGFIKTVLALKHRLIPPSLYFNTPNPQIDFENSPFYVNTTLKSWETNGYPLRAGVSSFGIGGTNAHVVLEEAPAPIKESAGENSRKMKLLLLSARSGYALNKQTEKLVQYLQEHPGIDIADAAYTLQVGRKHFPYRRMMVISTLNPEEGADKLIQAAQAAPIVLAKQENRPIFFMFCGQGSQYVNMGIDLYRTEPVFREEMDRCFNRLKSSLGCDLKRILYPDEGDKEAQRWERIHQPGFTLPVVFSFEYALAKLLMTWGIRPTAMIGYSFGEYAAACLSGVFYLEDALDMIVTRGQLIQQTPTGKMTSVTLPEHELKPLLNDNLSIAIVNGPTCIVSGKKEDVDAFEQAMKQKRIICVPLNMSHAIHSQVMNPIRERFQQKISQFRLNTPQIPFISNVTAQWITSEEVTTPGYWGAHLCSTVRFSDGLKELLKEENAIFIEIGPGRILGMMVRVHPDKKAGQMVLNTVKHPQERVSDDDFLLDKLGQLWQHGQSIDWAGFYGNEKRCRLPLPGYPFEGKRFWIEMKNFNPGDGIPLFSQAAGAGQGSETGIEAFPAEADNDAVPRNELEARIARMWTEMMGLDNVGIHDDFFNLNGSSLVATQLMARLMQEYQVEIPITRFYEEPTIAHLAEIIQTVSKKQEVDADGVH